MNKKVTILVFINVLLIGIVSSFSVSNAKNCVVTHIIVNAEILPDGSLMIDEKRHYRCDGKCRWAEYKLDLQKTGLVTDFSLSEANRFYEQHQKLKKTGTYQIYQDKDKFYAKWYFQANDESRIFHIKYRVENTVTVYQDIADFNYEFVHGMHTNPIDKVDITLSLLFAADTSRVNVWLHGPVEGRYNIENGSIHTIVSSLPAFSALDLRVAFPPIWVHKASKYKNFTFREQIVKQEEEWAINAYVDRMQAYRKNAQLHYHQMAVYWSLAIVILGWLIYIFLYIKYGRGHSVDYHHKLSPDLPENLSPALAHYIYNFGHVRKSVITATIFDLAKWSYFKIDESLVQVRNLFRKKSISDYTLKLIPEVFEEDYSQLNRHELNLVEFLFHRLANNEIEIRFKDIKRNRAEVIKWFQEWKRLLKEQWGNKRFFDKMSVRSTIFCAIFGIVMMITGTLEMIYIGNPGIICFASGMLFFFLSFLLLRYSKDTKLLRKQIIAFRNYLTNFYFLDKNIGTKTAFEDYIIYGIALNVKSKILKELLELTPHNQITYHFPWYQSSVAHEISSDFTDSFISMMTTVKNL